VYEKMIGGDQTIAAEWLRERFGVTTDPCNRGATVKADSVWTNRGDSCVVSAKTTIFLDKALLFDIQIPQRLAFRQQVVNGELNLSPAGPLPIVEFRDADLAQDWGGPIYKVISTTTKSQFQMLKGCIEVAHQ